MNSLIISIIILLLHPPLPVSFHHHLHRPYLLHALLLPGDELTHEQVLAHHYPLLIDDVIELALFLLDDVLLLVLLVVIIIVLLVIEVFLGLLGLLLLIRLGVELVKDVLDLPLELFVTRLHEVVEDFRHAELFGLLTKLLPGEDGVEGAVHIGAHLQVVMLHQVIEHFQELYLGLLTFVLACCPQR